MLDLHGRQLLYRSDLSKSMEKLLPAINADALKFMASVRHPFSETAMQENVRGPHFFSIAGHDRESSKVCRVKPCLPLRLTTVTEAPPKQMAPTKCRPIDRVVSKRRCLGCCAVSDNLLQVDNNLTQL